MFPSREHSFSSYQEFQDDVDSYNNDFHDQHYQSFSVPLDEPISLPKMRASSILTEEIIKKISKSVKVFRPSKSLEMMLALDNDDPQKPEVEMIDVVISGGGLKAYFICGCVAVLQHQLSSRNIQIARVAGASAGAWSGLFICAGLSTSLWLESYHKCFENPHKTIHECYVEDLWPLALEIMPDNAYELCSGRLFISITVVTTFGLKNLIVSEFESNNELLEACLASSAIPYVTERGFARTFRGLTVVDGGMTNNTPVFPDGVRRQLVFRLSRIEYPWRLLINPVDTCIDALVIRGSLQMARFLQGEFCPAIAWLEHKQGENDLVRPGHKRRSFLAKVFVAGLIAWRTSGLSILLEFFDISTAAAQGSFTRGNTIIDFEDAKRVLGGSALMYALGGMYATVLAVANRLHLLL